MPKSRRFLSAQNRREWLLPALFIAPALAVLLSLSIYPLIYSITISLQQETSSGALWSVGNFTRLVSDNFFLTAMVHTLVYAVAALGCEFPLGLGLALLLNSKMRGRGLFRASLLVLLAGLQAIPEEPYEAALIDGSSRWQTFWHVTLPLLKPSILIVLLLRTMDLLRVFDQIFILTEGGPGFATETISLYIYRTAFRFFDFGYAAAMSFVLLALTNVISVIYIKVLHEPQKGT